MSGDPNALPTGHRSDWTLRMERWRSKLVLVALRREGKFAADEPGRERVLDELVYRRFSIAPIQRGTVVRVEVVRSKDEEGAWYGGSRVG